MQVTVQKVPCGKRPEHRLERLGAGVDSPRNAEDEVDPQRRLEHALLEPAHGADDVADVEALDLERDPRALRLLDDPAAGRGRRDERLVAEVHRSRLDAGDVRLRLEAGRALVDRHVVGAAGRDHRQDRAARPDPVDHLDEQLGAPARRPVVLPHVQMGDRRARASRSDRRVGDLRSRIGHVRIRVAEHVGAGDGDGDHDGVRVPTHRLSSSAAMPGGGTAERLSLRLADRSRLRGARGPRARARTRPRRRRGHVRRGSAPPFAGSRCRARRRSSRQTPRRRQAGSPRAR